MSSNPTSNGTEGPKSFVRRDKLRSIEKKVQAVWAEQKTFECDAPTDPEAYAKKEKFMCTFPYPYMNGRLHLGHAFTVCKAEFAAGFQRLKGKHVLFPFAFHCTGMPIQAAANKLKREIATGTHLPVAEDEVMEETVATTTTTTETTTPAETTTTANNAEKELGKFSGKKSKAVAKTGGATVTTWTILEKSGIAPADIPKFQDPSHWLEYFPPLGQKDLESFGAHVDWRRSFITTDANPYYDSFIRWQFNKLKEREKIGFGKRFTIYSPLDGQACADHDRASGEGLNPQEYTLIKLGLQNVPDKHFAKDNLASLSALLNNGKKVFFVAATLRPETMYGQTNCFLLPEGEYGAFEINDTDVFICSERSARNMAYQGMSKENGVVKCLGMYKGEELLGLPLSAPYAKYETVYTLPLLTISMKKGTGVVTSVPSDAPDDFAALRDLKNKQAFREKYHLDEVTVAGYEPVEIIDIPNYGKLAAVKVCDDLKIKSQNDKDKLAEAKDKVYMAGFYQGVMLVGKYAGKKVCDAKPLVRNDMITEGHAAVYWEPEGLVMSRSGDECVVTGLDQWYLKYGENDWRNAVETWIKSDKFKSYSPAVQASFESTVAWLKEWACSRSFGLGTKLPWDPTFVIESLSDSTIYMAYYTVAHLLQGGNLAAHAPENSKPGPLNIRPEQLNDHVWDFVFQGTAYPGADAVNGIPETSLLAMRREFEFWYPMDLRVSGKDLIGNHLTMSLYNHAAIWPTDKFDPVTRMPQSFFCNGHVQVDGEKMSKSKGNFIVLEEAIERWGSDCTRFALADAGDTTDDANFEREKADSAILRLTTEEEWMMEILKAEKEGKLRPSNSPRNFSDRVFESRMSKGIQEASQAYDCMRYRDALNASFYQYQLDRDTYRDMCAKMQIPMHAGVLRRFMESQYVMLAPICPHFCEFVWKDILNMAGSVTVAPWPKAGAIDEVLLAQDRYIQYNIHAFRVAITKHLMGKPKKGVIVNKDIVKATDVYIYVASGYNAWQTKVLSYLATLYNIETNGTSNFGFPIDALNMVKNFLLSDNDLKPLMKKGMELASNVIAGHKDKTEPLPSLKLQVMFDEYACWQDNSDYVSKALDIPNIHIMRIEDDGVIATDATNKAKDVNVMEPWAYGFVQSTETTA